MPYLSYKLNPRLGTTREGYRRQAAIFQNYEVRGCSFVQSSLEQHNKIDCHILFDRVSPLLTFQINLAENHNRVKDIQAILFKDIMSKLLYSCCLYTTRANPEGDVLITQHG